MNIVTPRALVRDVAWISSQMQGIQAKFVGAFQAFVGQFSGISRFLKNSEP
jgi:hypothetical protein